MQMQIVPSTTKNASLFGLPDHWIVQEIPRENINYAGTVDRVFFFFLLFYLCYVEYMELCTSCKQLCFLLAIVFVTLGLHQDYRCQCNMLAGIANEYYKCLLMLSQNEYAHI